jgi:hypothetical protein
MYADTSHPTSPPHHSVPRGWRWAIAGAALGLTLASAPLVQAMTVRCGAGDVACLINAIHTANANGEANTITLAAGTYTLTDVDNTTDGPNGLPSITGTITIVGDSAATTIVGRPDLPPFGGPPLRIFHVPPTGTLALEKLTVTGGSLQDSSWDGAGIFNASGTLTLTQSIVTQNYGGLNTTGVGIASDNGTLNITDSAMVSNLAEGACGGLLSTDGTVAITHSTISNNGADFVGGLCTTATMLIVNSTVAHNFAETTGGIANGGTLTILNSTIAENGQRNLAGTDSGGGITNGGMLTVINSTISGNTTEFGHGGGITSGGGTVQLQNTILALNTALNGTGGDCLGAVSSLGNNLIGDPTNCTITLLPSDLTGDPGLDAFTDNGTPGNGHFPLLPDSAAIDAGNDAACPSTDQLGEPRVGPCDIGAIEFQPAVLTVVIDIKPGSDPAPINPKSKGKIPVAILTTDTFDATTVDPTTVRFGRSGTEATSVQSALEDVDGDGTLDMILHFNTQDTGIQCGQTSGSLTGKTVSGQAIQGSDSIQTVGCKM